MACYSTKVDVNDSDTEFYDSNLNQAVVDGVVVKITKVGVTVVSSIASVPGFEGSKGIIGTWVQNISRIDIQVNCATIAGFLGYGLGSPFT